MIGRNMDAAPPRPSSFPRTLLILGTDMAGKDHFANVVADAALHQGLRVERRRGAFSAAADRMRTSEGKGLLRLALEWAFLRTLPLHVRLLPHLTALLLLVDLRRFHRPGDRLVMVVSHTAIRLLAFALGHLYDRIEDIRLPALARKALRRVGPATGACVLALDIDHRVRAARMAERGRRGTVDCFDRYLGQDPVRSERIEAILVWIGVHWLGAVRVENNDLGDRELLAHLPGWQNTEAG